jgi:hypothetical protein
MKQLAVILVAASLLGACASAAGSGAHPHGYGHRDSPGRAMPTPLPLPGYDYRFRFDPQGLGRDLPAPMPHPGAYAIHEAPVAWPHDGPVHSRMEQYVTMRSGESYSVREGYSEDVYVEGGYLIEGEPYVTAPRPYLEEETFY